jgi:hypothetical protein
MRRSDHLSPCSTVITVGYGDRFPVTAPGRATGAGVMILGISLFGLPAASSASLLVEKHSERRSIRRWQRSTRGGADGAAPGKLQPSDEGADVHQPRLDLATAPRGPPPKDRDPGRDKGRPGPREPRPRNRERQSPSAFRPRRRARGRRGPRRSHTPVPHRPTTLARCDVSADGTTRSQHPNPLSEEQGARNEAPDADREANCRCLSVPDEE